MIEMKEIADEFGKRARANIIEAVRRASVRSLTDYDVRRLYDALTGAGVPGAPDHD